MLRRFTLEVLILLIMAGLSIVFLRLALTFPHTPGQFPKVVSSFTLVLSVFLLISKFLPGAKVDRGKSVKPGPNGLSWISFSVLMVLYGAMIQTVGFVLATFLYLLCCPFLMGLKNPLRLGALAIVSTLVLFACMKWGLQIPMPMGFLFE